jgi:hypothetical protein
MSGILVATREQVLNFLSTFVSKPVTFITSAAHYFCVVRKINIVLKITELLFHL